MQPKKEPQGSEAEPRRAQRVDSELAFNFALFSISNPSDLVEPLKQDIVMDLNDFNPPQVDTRFFNRYCQTDDVDQSFEFTWRGQW